MPHEDDDGEERAPPTIVVDVNEPSSIPDRLAGLGIDVVRQRLAPADYVVGPIALERKSVGDFHASLVQKRLFEQLTRLREAYPPPVALILEGDLGALDDLQQPRSFWGALLSVALDLDVRVIPTPSREGTCEMLAVLADRVARGARGSGGVDVRFKPKLLTPEMEQRFAVQGLRGIGDVTSDTLLERFGSLRRLFAASERELLRVPGIGKKRASEITELLDRPYAGPQRRLAAHERDDA